MILDVGPAALEALADVLKTCRTLVWNGPLGAFEMPPFDAATVALAKTAAALTKEGSLVSVAGGGDTVAALNHAGVAGDFTFVSTAGGAFLEWMEGRTLPGCRCARAPDVTRQARDHVIRITIQDGNQSRTEAARSWRPTAEQWMRPNDQRRNDLEDAHGQRLHRRARPVGGSTPKALKGYGLDESAWSTDEEMFGLIHKMRERIITSPCLDRARSSAPSCSSARWMEISLASLRRRR